MLKGGQFALCPALNEPTALDGMLVHRKVTFSSKFAGTSLCTWVKRGTMRVKCLAQEYNVVPPNRART